MIFPHKGATDGIIRPATIDPPMPVVQARPKRGRERGTPQYSPYASDRPTDYGGGRRCETNGCSTILRRTSPGPHCSVHMRKLELEELDQAV